MWERSEKMNEGTAIQVCGFNFGVDTRAKRFCCDEKVLGHDRGFN